MSSSLLAYKDACTAIENYDIKFDSEWPALESLQTDMESIAEDMNPKLQDAAGRFNAAVTAEKYDDAINALTDIENIAKTWKKRLAALPPESMSKTVLRTTGKVAAVLVSCLVLAASPTINASITGWFAHSFKSLAATKVVLLIKDITVNGKAFGVLFRAISSLFMKIAHSGDANGANAYKNDPNHHNANYVAAQVGLDEWLSKVALAKAELRKMQAGQK